MNTTCPHCGRSNEAHLGRTPEARPTPGDVSLCWGCLGLAIFTEDGLRHPTPEEAVVLANDQELQRARAAIRATRTPTEAAEVWRQP